MFIEVAVRNRFYRRFYRFLVKDTRLRVQILRGVIEGFEKIGFKYFVIQSQ